uniref:Neuron navigator 3 n=1 Tax=Schistosoma haematobium TaxID=6185 RepID=A0A095A7L7_SCHHA
MNCSLEFLCIFSLKLYTDWANHYLEKANYSNLIKNIQKDLSNGLLLADIIHAVANIKVQRLCRNPKTSAQSLHNVLACFQVLQLLGIETNGFTPQDIVDSKLKYILGLFFNLSKFKQKTKKLQQSQVNTITSSSIIHSSVLTTTTTTTTTPSTTTIPTKATITSIHYPSMIKLQKNHISNENDTHHHHHHHQQQQQHHDHHQDSLIVQSTPPRPPPQPPPRTVTNNNNTTTTHSSLSKQTDLYNKLDSPNNISSNNNNLNNGNPHHHHRHYQSGNKQENLLIGQLKYPIKNLNETLSNPYSNPLILNKNNEHYDNNHNANMIGINASLNFTKPK